jgi:YhcH/YjgK/YiaL family protein
MIYDHLSQQARYRSCHPGLDVAFDYLLGFSPTTPDGKYPLDGERIFALVQSYATQPVAVRRFESHRSYLDLQYLVSGEELFFHSPLPRLTTVEPYSAAKDCELYSGPTEQALVLRPGDFAVLFPHDGHIPGCSYGKAQLVKKIVLKIRVDA